MKHRLRILVDMDDVMENLREEWLRVINSMYNTNVLDSEIVTWDIAKHVGRYMDNPDRIFNILETESFWMGVKPLPNAVKYLKRLQDDGHEIFVVTATSPETYKFKSDWVLKRFFPFISPRNVIATHHKNMIVGDVIIDDAPHNLIGTDIPDLKLMMDAPYNQDVDIKANNIIRVFGWEDIYGHIEQYIKPRF